MRETDTKMSRVLDNFCLQTNSSNSSAAKNSFASTWLFNSNSLRICQPNLKHVCQLQQLQCLLLSSLWLPSARGRLPSLISGGKTLQEDGQIRLLFRRAGRNEMQDQSGITFLRGRGQRRMGLPKRQPQKMHQSGQRLFFGRERRRRGEGFGGPNNPAASPCPGCCTSPPPERDQKDYTIGKKGKIFDTMSSGPDPF